MDGQHPRRYPCVIAQGVRVATEQKLSLDAATITLYLGRLRLEDARERLHRRFVTTLVDVDLCLFC